MRNPPRRMSTIPAPIQSVFPPGTDTSASADCMGLMPMAVTPMPSMTRLIPTTLLILDLRRVCI